MKTENEFKDILHDMGFDPFFLHYHSPVQIHVYRSYCKSSSCPKIIIDATGSVVKSFIIKLKTNHFRGVFSCDNLPKKTHTIECDILNLDIPSGYRSHFVGFF